MMTLTTSLSDEIKSGLRHHLALLIEADEPEAVLGSLRRIVEHKIKTLIRDVTKKEEAQRWSILLEALLKVQEEMVDLHGIYSESDLD
jgi:hypothetical protein